MARNRGQQTERDILKKIGARRQPASGAIAGFPNDGILGKFLIEVKSTQRGSLGLKREWVETLEENAISRGKVPALIIIFNTQMPCSCDEWVAIPRRDFEKLTKGWKKS
ncbi:MAG: hypothetical protein Q8P35_00575 [Candidatus Yanofskybacteria bacterium]|nr:hypothetical protein [Candidatus Yanofskybacteria bacterium]